MTAASNRRVRRVSWLLAALVVAAALVASVWQWFLAQREEWLSSAPIPVLRAASERDPADHELAYRLSFRLVTMGEHPEAAARMESLVKKEPRSSLYWLGYARAAAGAGEVARAVNAYRRAAELAPNDADPAYSLAQVYADAGLYRDALPLLEKASQHKTPTMVSLETWAECLAALGKDQEAWDKAMQVIEHEPMQDTLYPVIAELGVRLRREEDAEKKLRRRIGLVRGYPTGMVRAPLARLMLRRGTSAALAEAEELAREAVRDPAPKPQFTAALAEVLIATGRRDEARSVLAREKAKRGADPDCEELLALLDRSPTLADVASRLGRPRDSRVPDSAEVQRLRQRLAGNPGDTEVRAALVRALQKSGRAGDGAEQCWVALETVPADPQFTKLLNECREQALQQLANKIQSTPHALPGKS
ncbi:MAG: tetratricopeptide repeat protein [Armatimonadota bacterium]